MSKHNGKNNGISEVSHHDDRDRTTSREKHHFDKPEVSVPIRDGISIAAAGDGASPSEVHIYTKVPGTQFAGRFSFREPALLGDLIEQLIAYRRYVFPDAPEIDTNATLEE